MTADVAIIGIGMHPFGRTDALSGLEQGAHAVRAALQDAGLSWDAVGVAYGGSQDAGNADALANLLGLTGTPFVNVANGCANGCATGGSALASVDAAIRSGMAEIGVAVGFDKHPRGAFNARPADWGLEDWYGATGLMLTTQFFALKTQRYLHEVPVLDERKMIARRCAFELPLGGVINLGSGQHAGTAASEPAVRLLRWWRPRPGVPGNGGNRLRRQCEREPLRPSPGRWVWRAPCSTGS